MADYNLAALSPHEFEHLLHALTLKYISPDVTPFGDGPDGGREATCHGQMEYRRATDEHWSGYLVVQAKFRQQPTGDPQEDGGWVLDELRKELPGFSDSRHKPPRVDYYLFATNLKLTAVQDTGWKEKVFKVLADFSKTIRLKDYDIWDYDKICRLLDDAKEIRNRFAHFMGPGDLPPGDLPPGDVAPGDVPPGFTLRHTLVGGHKAPIGQIAWSPDGRMLASPSQDKTVAVWDADNGTQISTFSGHQAGATCVSWSPNASPPRFASGSIDGTIRIWSVDSREPRLIVAGSGGPVFLVAWSPDGQRIVSGSREGTLRLFWANNGELIRTLKGMSGGVFPVVWSPDGKQIACGSRGGGISILDSETGKRRLKLEGGKRRALSLAWSPAGQIIASGVADGTIWIWDPKTGDKVLTLVEHGTPGQEQNWLVGVSFSWDGRLLATSGSDYAVRLWRTDTWDQVVVLDEQALGGPPTAYSSTKIAFHPTGPVLATLGEGDHGPDTAVRIWDLDLGVLLGDTDPSRSARSGKLYTRGGGFYLWNLADDDVWTTEDRLGYAPYVEAIARPILAGTTKPPLTIAIQAPWGQGKTSLMRMIQQLLNPSAVPPKNRAKGKSAKKASTDDGKSAGKRMTFKSLLKEAKRGPDKASGGKRTTFESWLKWVKDKLGKVTPCKPKLGKKEIPTVWFNPLFYQTSKQVWAGMAHAMLHQLADNLPNQLAREEFWLKLQLRRLNYEAIRRDFHKYLLGKFMPKLFVWTVGGLCLTALLLSESLEWGLGGLGSVLTGGFSHLLWDWRKTRNTNLTDKFERYISEPDYSSELGYLRLVHDDLDKALELLGGIQTVVVFIDDLDRCPPETVSEVILAINRFLSVEDGKDGQVMFILGLDMAMVASALNASQGKWLGIQGGSGSERKAFGWRYMEKFVQLPFLIPRVDIEEAKEFLETSLKPEEAPGRERKDSEERSPTVPAPASMPAEIQEAIQDATDADSMARLEDVAKASRAPDVARADRVKIQQAVARRAQVLMGDPHGPEATELAELAMEELACNPRSIKRFLNLVKLLRSIQVSRGEPDVDRARLIAVRCTQLILNWPHFVTWLQHGDRMYDTKGDTVNVAKKLVEKATSVPDLEGWEAAIEGELGEVAAARVKHAGLYAFIKRTAADPPSLEDLYEARLF